MLLTSSGLSTDTLLDALRDLLEMPQYFPDCSDAWAGDIVARAGFPLYFVDDDAAVRVVGDTVERHRGRRQRGPLAGTPAVTGAGEPARARMPAAATAQAPPITARVTP